MVNILGGLELLFNPHSETKTTREPLDENYRPMTSFKEYINEEQIVQ